MAKTGEVSEQMRDSTHTHTYRNTNKGGRGLQYDNRQQKGRSETDRKKNSSEFVPDCKL